MPSLPVQTNDDEPEWSLLITDPLEIQEARSNWARVAGEMREAGRWTATNNHAVLRLIMAYLLYDRSLREVLEKGAIVASSKTKVPQHSLHYNVMSASAEAALRLEADLMISPRKRGKTPIRSARRGGGVTL